MRLLVPLLLLYQYVLSCVSTSAASSPVTTSTESPITTTTTGTSTSTSTTTLSTTTTTATTTTTTTTMPCPVGWSLFETNCFMFVATAANGVVAAQNCAVLGAALATIHNQAENDFVAGLITGGVRTYIGIVHPNTNPATFMWSDGSTWGPYTNWKAGEPDNILGEMCGIINIAVGDGQWGDVSYTAASNNYRYVCEQPAT